VKPHNVIREELIAASPQTLWEMVVVPERMGAWFAFADRMETIDGEGVGRRQRLHGHWGRKSSEIDQVVVTFDRPSRFAWEHEAERLDGKPAPRFAALTRFTIEMEPRGESTMVRMTSHQVPASGIKGLVMKLFGTREVAQNIERSLEALKKAAEN
jgi:uncharacterized protein YndB with AHSA1/START domain